MTGTAAMPSDTDIREFSAVQLLDELETASGGEGASSSAAQQAAWARRRADVRREIIKRMAK